MSERQKVSDEIRRRFNVNSYGGGVCLDKYGCDKMCDLADRIDREMVELPASVDGRTWDGHEDGFWTRAMNGTYEYHSLSSLDLKRGTWYVRDIVGLGYIAETAWHERPDSLGIIADELEEWSEDNRVNGCGDVFDKAAEFARRIRRLAEKEAEGGKD